jgi:hypothetical protein
VVQNIIYTPFSNLIFILGFIYAPIWLKYTYLFTPFSKFIVVLRYYLALLLFEGEKIVDCCVDGIFKLVCEVEIIHWRLKPIYLM